jgi:hypothetical protein
MEVRGREVVVREPQLFQLLQLRPVLLVGENIGLGAPMSPPLSSSPVSG